METVKVGLTFDQCNEVVKMEMEDILMDDFCTSRKIKKAAKTILKYYSALSEWENIKPLLKDKQDWREEVQ